MCRPKISEEGDRRQAQRLSPESISLLGKEHPKKRGSTNVPLQEACQKETFQMRAVVKSRCWELRGSPERGKEWA